MNYKENDLNDLLKTPKLSMNLIYPQANNKYNLDIVYAVGWHVLDHHLLLNPIPIMH